ncbi:hypothetical protein BZA77DRAFT_35187 [Pyronema omphalodes]|nr:hypothetical protein BZA77DRAFT_35187 [Pyronema omphalodes]
MPAAIPHIPTEFVKLFGGHMTVQIPQNFQDASAYRPVPDTQEVFVSKTYDTDISIVFDILCRVEGSDEEAVNAHWEDVAVEDGRSQKLFQTGGAQVPGLPNIKAIQLIGTINKPTDSAFTALLMTIIRLEAQKTDFVVTVNVPFLTPEQVAAEGMVAAPQFQGELSGEPGALLQAGLAIRDRILETLKVEDWGLFVDDE